MEENRGVVIQGLDLMDIIKFVARKNKKYQAMLLNDLEEVLPPESEEYKAARKLFLDCFNNYTRSVLRAIFGDVEHLMN